MTIDPARFRRVLSHLPTGVSVVTADTPAGPTGMAANSVASVSLDPPMILFCPAKSSTTWPAVRASGRFCVNVLAGHHVELTRAFAAKDVDRFAGVEHRPSMAGPVLAEAVAWIACAIDAEHDAGDHTIVVARVLALEASVDVEPLVFFQGRFGSFVASDRG